MDQTEVGARLAEIAQARQYCGIMDTFAEKLEHIDSIIANEKNKHLKQQHRFKGVRVLLLYLLVTIIAFLPMSVLVVLLGLEHYSWLIPIINVAITIIAKIIYEQRQLTVYKPIYEQIIGPYVKEMGEHKENLLVYLDEYNETIQCIPKDLQYTIALDFIHEAIRQRYCSTLDEAIEFYRERLKTVYSEQTNEADLLRQDIQKSQEMMALRLRMIRRLTMADSRK